MLISYPFKLDQSQLKAINEKVLPEGLGTAVVHESPAVFQLFKSIQICELPELDATPRKKSIGGPVAPTDTCWFPGRMFGCMAYVIGRYCDGKQLPGICTRSLPHY